MQSLAVTVEFPSSLEQRVGWQTYTRHHSSEQHEQQSHCEAESPHVDSSVDLMMQMFQKTSEVICPITSL